MNRLRKKGSARKIASDLEKLLSKNNKAKAKKILSKLTYSDIAKIIDLARSRIAIFRLLPADAQVEVLFLVGLGVRKNIIRSLTQAEIDALLYYTDRAEEEVILNHRKDIDGEQQEERASDYKQEIEEMTQLFPEVADLIRRNFVVVEENFTVEDVAKKVDEYLKNFDEVPVIIATDNKRKTLGRVYFAHIIAADKDEPIDHLISDAIVINGQFEKGKLISLLKKHPKDDLVITANEDDIPIGIVHAKDLIKVIEDEASKKLLKFAGVQKEETATDSVSTTVNHRLKWLVINLLTSLGAVAIISLFQNTLSEMVILAAYMPIVASMGGNAGTQTLAVVIRSLALGEIEPGVGKKIVIKEMIAGILNGAANGVIIALVAYILNKNIMLGVVLALAMIFNLLAAGFFGTVIPLTLKKLNIDPAVSSAVLLTTATDMIGFLVFLGLASAVLL